MAIRPSTGWIPLHPNYISGFAAIATPFVIYPLRKLNNIPRQNSTLNLLIFSGLALVIFALLMATSRGILLAIAAGVGVWFLGGLVYLGRIRLKLGHEAIFPSIVLIFLLAVIVALYGGPATAGESVSPEDFGNGSRGELFGRSLYLVTDFPFTGGGLGAFPALYSQYILNIPYYYLPNSHNLFLDVFIEQGVFGGVAFFALYLLSIWNVARTVMLANSSGTGLFGWVVLATLVIAFVHGMVDNYLYFGNGTLLSLVLAGIAVSFFRSESRTITEKKRIPVTQVFYLAAGITVASLFFLNLDRVRSAWYANLGAVQMAQVELRDFPAKEWVGLAIAPKLDFAEETLHSSFEADPAHRTANHRLGLIALLRRDFSSAAGYLERAHAHSPNHRGITKALGYCYVWLGKLDHAQPLLNSLPEAKDELDVYVWWWQVQGRDDISHQASLMLSRLASSSLQP
jgi:hypothetical protein